MRMKVLQWGRFPVLLPPYAVPSRGYLEALIRCLLEHATVPL